PSLVFGLSKTMRPCDTPLLPCAKPSLIWDMPPQIDVSPRESRPNQDILRCIPNWTSQAFISGGRLPLNAPIAFESFVSEKLKALNTNRPVARCLDRFRPSPFVEVSTKACESAASIQQALIRDLSVAPACANFKSLAPLFLVPQSCTPLVV